MPPRLVWLLMPCSGCRIVTHILNEFGCLNFRSGEVLQWRNWVPEFSTCSGEVGCLKFSSVEVLQSEFCSGEIGCLNFAFAVTKLGT